MAYLVCKQEIDLAALRQHLLRTLPEYMVPGHFEKIGAVPLNPNGKADRKALPEPVIGPKAS